MQQHHCGGRSLTMFMVSKFHAVGVYVFYYHGLFLPLRITPFNRSLFIDTLAGLTLATLGCRI